jgi:hypothetical protein
MEARYELTWVFGEGFDEKLIAICAYPVGSNGIPASMRIGAE